MTAQNSQKCVGANPPPPPPQLKYPEFHQYLSVWKRGTEPSRTKGAMSLVLFFDTLSKSPAQLHSNSLVFRLVSQMNLWRRPPPPPPPAGIGWIYVGSFVWEKFIHWNICILQSCALNSVGGFHQRRLHLNFKHFSCALQGCAYVYFFALLLTFLHNFYLFSSFSLISNNLRTIKRRNRWKYFISGRSTVVSTQSRVISL